MHDRGKKSHRHESAVVVIFSGAPCPTARGVSGEVSQWGKSPCASLTHGDGVCDEHGPPLDIIHLNIVACAVMIPA